jgi:hypothetical protein
LNHRSSPSGNVFACIPALTNAELHRVKSLALSADDVKGDPEIDALEESE